MFEFHYVTVDSTGSVKFEYSDGRSKDKLLFASQINPVSNAIKALQEELDAGKWFTIERVKRYVDDDSPAATIEPAPLDRRDKYRREPLV